VSPSKEIEYPDPRRLKVLRGSKSYSRVSIPPSPPSQGGENKGHGSWSVPTAFHKPGGANWIQIGHLLTFLLKWVTLRCILKS